MKKLMLSIFAMLFGVQSSCFAKGGELDVTVVDKKCGEAEMSLQCAQATRGIADCLHPSLVFRSKSGSKRLPLPKGLKDSAPTGLACVVSKNDGTRYFHVMYSVLPMGCDICEWQHLYDTNGNLLTTSDPATIAVSTASPAQSIAPNNRSFDELSKRLNLGKFEDTNVVCEGPHVDSEGTLVCAVEIN